MRFKDFLTEAKSPLTKYRRNLDIMIENELVLFRGTRPDPANRTAEVSVTIPTNSKDWTFNVNIFEYPTRTSPRHSQTGFNLFLDLASEWEGFPNRKLATFATQKGKHASNFGKFGVVIPADSVDLFGFVPTDFNESKAKNAASQFRKQLESTAGGVKYVLEKFMQAYANIEKGNEFRNTLMDALHDHGLQDMDSMAVYRMKFGKDAMKVAELVDWSIRSHSKLSKLANEGYGERLVGAIGELRDHLQGNGAAKTVVDLFKLVSPENYKAKAFTSLSQVPVKEVANEVWFVGDYLFIELPLSGSSFPKEYALNTLKSLRDKA